MVKMLGVDSFHGWNSSHIPALAFPISLIPVWIFTRLFPLNPTWHSTFIRCYSPQLLSTTQWTCATVCRDAVPPMDRGSLSPYVSQAQWIVRQQLMAILPNRRVGLKGKRSQSGRERMGMVVIQRGVELHSLTLRTKLGCQAVLRASRNRVYGGAGLQHGLILFW